MPDCQSSDSIRRRKKSRLAKDIVIHHQVSPLPPDDWILFPEEVVVTKHSSVRESRNRKIGPTTQLDQPSESVPTLKVTSKEPGKVALVYLETSKDDDFARSPKRPLVLANSVDKATLIDGSMQPRKKLSQRLPTPDISDIDEDGFWSCCGSSEKVDKMNLRSKHEDLGKHEVSDVLLKRSKY